MASSWQRLYGFGQILESEIPIPGAIPASDDRGAPGIEIVTVPDVTRSDELFSLNNGQILYAPAGVGSFHCSEDRISIAREGGVEPGLISELLIANAIPAAVWQQGSFMLHASAVQLTGVDGAVAIAGDSGVGKSTVARALLQAGGSLVGDDSIRIDRVGSYYRTAGLPGGLLSWSEDGKTRLFETVSAGLADAELRAIVILGARISDGFELVQCNLVQSVELILAHRHRAVIADLLGHHQSALDWVIKAAEAVPVFVWHRAVGAIDVSEAEVAALRRAFDQ